MKGVDNFKLKNRFLKISKMERQILLNLELPNCIVVIPVFHNQCDNLINSIRVLSNSGTENSMKKLLKTKINLRNISKAGHNRLRIPNRNSNAWIPDFYYAKLNTCH